MKIKKRTQGKKLKPGKLAFTLVYEHDIISPIWPTRVDDHFADISRKVGITYGILKRRDNA